MLPNLIVIGAQKSGTTSLHFYLGCHPEVYMSRPKELDYFSAERNWSRGQGWYEGRFPVDVAIRGESSPNYTNYPREPGVPERMHALVPEARLIYLLRDPVDRIVSHYVHESARGREARPFEAALGEIQDTEYLARSQYAMQLERFLRFYPRERILLITHRELLRDRAATLRGVFRFLGVDETFTSPRFAEERYRSDQRRQDTRLARWVHGWRLWRLARAIDPGRTWRVKQLVTRPISRPIPRPAASPELRGRLAAALAADVARLRALTGRDFADWSL